MTENDLIACKECGAVYTRHPATQNDKCVACGYDGRTLHYVGGETGRSRWYDVLGGDPDA